MAVTVNVAGLCAVYVDTGTGLDLLGYTRQGADVRDQAFFVDVPGDQNGGDQGPPIDIQYMGEIAKVRLELTKWDAAIGKEIRSRLAGGTEGTPGGSGTLMFDGSKTARVLLYSPNGPMNFPRAFLRDPWEVNLGTKYSTLVLEFEAHKDATGVLYNAVVT